MRAFLTLGITALRVSLWKRECFIFCGALVILYEICIDLFLLLGWVGGGGAGRKVNIDIKVMVRSNLLNITSSERRQ